MRFFLVATMFVAVLGASVVRVQAATPPADPKTAGRNDWRDQGVLYLNQSLNARLRPIPIQAVHLGNGFWSERRRVTTERSLPTMLDLLEEHGAIDNFRRLSEHKNVPRRGPLYTDSDVYKWMEAASWALASNETSEPARARLRSQLESLIPIIAGAQEPGGYLNTYYVGEREKLRFTELTRSHEGYCLGHLIQAGIAYYRATGSRALLDPGIRFADYLVDNFGPTKRPFITGHPELEMALVELYRTTGNARYLDFVRYLFSGIERDRLKLKDADLRYMFSGRPFTSRTEFEGHAVRALYASSGATDYLIEAGDPAYRRTLDLLWTDLTSRKMYITGGVGAHASGESFGEPYDLPNLDAYAETCAAVANVMWNFRMLMLTGDAQYADVLERALYNGVNSGMSLAGNLYCYRNPLAWSGSEKLRNPWYDTDCCPPNVERLFESLPGYFYASARDGIYLNLYHNSEVDWHLTGGPAVRLTQATSYPWDGDIRVTVDPAKPVNFTVYLRWPRWAPSADVSVNGQPVPVSGLQPGSYIPVNRTWKPGDTISCVFPMQPVAVVANPRVLIDTGRVAMQRGPLVYAAEQVDQPAALGDLNARLSGPMTAESRKELLGGVTVLKVSGQSADKTYVQEPLYSPLSVAAARAKRPVTLTFIPFYAVENREPDPMEVWIPAVP